LVDKHGYRIGHGAMYQLAIWRIIRKSVDPTMGAI
jgi:hypothetical protein